MTALELTLFVIAFVSWATATVDVVQALRRFRPDVSPWSRKFLYNPMNALVFHPETLTDDGAIYRKRCGKGLAVFLAAMLCAVVAASFAS